MASIVFEKQLTNIQKGLQALKAMNKELSTFEKGSNSNKILKNVIKGAKDAENGIKSMKIEADSVSFDKAHKSINKFNNNLKHTKKYLDSVYSKLKMISFASVAGIGSIAAIGTALASNAKGGISNKTFALTSNGITQRDLSALMQLGKKHGDENLFINALNTLTNTATSTEGSKHLANLGLNQTEIINALNDKDIYKRFATLQKVMKELAKHKDDVNVDVFKEAGESLLGINATQSYAHLNRFKGIDLTTQFKNIRGVSNNEAVYNNVEKVGQAFIDLQYTLNQFKDWIISNFKGSFEKIFNSIKYAFDIIKNNKGLQNTLNAFSDFIASNVPKFIGNAFEMLMNIPTYFEKFNILLNKIHLAIKNVKDSIIYSFTSLALNLSQVEIFGGKPFANFKPSDKTLAEMYANKYANILSGINIKEAEKGVLQKQIQNSQSFFALTNNNNNKDKEAKNNIETEITKLREELKELIQNAKTNNITINIEKDGNVKAQDNKGLFNTFVNLIK